MTVTLRNYLDLLGSEGTLSVQQDDLIVIFVHTYNSSQYSGVTISDTLGTSYTEGPKYFANSTDFRCFYGRATSAGSPRFTITNFNGGSTSGKALVFSGVPTGTTVFDKGAWATSSGNAATPELTPSQADTLLVAYLGDVWHGSGFTFSGDTNGFTPVTDAPDGPMSHASYKVALASGAYSTEVTIDPTSTTMGCCLMAFNIGESGGNQPLVPSSSGHTKIWLPVFAGHYAPSQVNSQTTVGALLHELTLGPLTTVTAAELSTISAAIASGTASLSTGVTLTASGVGNTSQTPGLLSTGVLLLGTGLAVTYPAVSLTTAPGFRGTGTSNATHVVALTTGIQLQSSSTVNPSGSSVILGNLVPLVGSGTVASAYVTTLGSQVRLQSTGAATPVALSQLSAHVTLQAVAQAYCLTASNISVAIRLVGFNVAEAINLGGGNLGTEVRLLVSGTAVSTATIPSLTTSVRLQTHIVASPSNPSVLLTTAVKLSGFGAAAPTQQSGFYTSNALSGASWVVTVTQASLTTWTPIHAQGAPSPWATAELHTGLVLGGSASSIGAPLGGLTTTVQLTSNTRVEGLSQPSYLTTALQLEAHTNCDANSLVDVSTQVLLQGSGENSTSCNSSFWVKLPAGLYAMNLGSYVVELQVHQTQAALGLSRVVDSMDLGPSGEDLDLSKLHQPHLSL